MSQIRRIGDSRRWSDIVIFSGTARWVEVAEDRSPDFRAQTAQVLRQIDETLVSIGSSRQHLLQIQVFVADLRDVKTLNELWDAWVPEHHAPVRACVAVGMADGCLVEMVVVAAVVPEAG